MILIIDTSKNETIKLALEKDGQQICCKEIEAKYRQSEKLLPAIVDMLEENGQSLRTLESIRVSEEGEGFSSLRIGVLTANALAYALGIPVAGSTGVRGPGERGFGVVLPKYGKEPSIGEQKNK